MSGFFDNIASLVVEELADNFLENVVKACEEDGVVQILNYEKCLIHTRVCERELRAVNKGLSSRSTTHNDLQNIRRPSGLKARSGPSSLSMRTVYGRSARSSSPGES